jgi:hypothetical protein
MLFAISGHERYSPRYFSFSAAPLAVLVVLGIYEVLDLFGRAVRFSRRGIVLVLTAIIAASLAYPGGLYALHKPKEDWRGIAAAIVNRIEREPDKTFVVYETTFKKFPTLNYYLQRFSDDVRVDQTFPKKPERSSGPVMFSKPDTDYAIVAFTHHQVRDFPKTQRAFASKMTLAEEMLDEDGRGYLVYVVPR